MKKHRLNSHPEHLIPTPEEIRAAFVDRLGRPSTNVKKLAQENSILAVYRMAQLMFSENHGISLGAARALLKQAFGPYGPAGSAATRKQDKLKDEAVRITIRRFAEGKDDGDKRGDELPVVYGGWQGPRDLDVPCGPGVRKVRWQRKDTGDEPSVGTRTPKVLSGTGQQVRLPGELSAAAIKRILKAKARKKARKKCRK